MLSENVGRTISRIAFVATYPPRQCGIATFTADLREAVERTGAQTSVVPLDDGSTELAYFSPARFTVSQNDVSSYRQAAQYLNMSRVDVVSLQHEYGIFGGPAGSHILALLGELRAPIVTTLHTVLKDPGTDQREVIGKLADISDRLVVISECAGEFLRGVYGVPAYKIDVIPHGIPDIPFVDPNFHKDQFGVSGKHVLLTFGLLGPSKGIEHVIQALPQVLDRFSNVVYMVVGATHPGVVLQEGERYRLGLQRLVRELGVDDHVVFINRFVDPDELRDFIGAADIYISPYLCEEQVSSGTLAMAAGAGKATISTPYWYARELLDDQRGVLVPFSDSDALSRAIVNLLEDDAHRHAIRKRAYLFARNMTWSNVAQQYLEAFLRAQEHRTHRPRCLVGVRSGQLRRGQLPQISLRHLLRMTDDTGLLQHAKFSLPRYRDGYTTDDNARALILATRLRELGETPEDVVDDLMTRYGAFLIYALDIERGRFRNEMSYDRKWSEAAESEDCQGRAIWALGTVAGRRGLPDKMNELAAGVFNRVLPAVHDMGSLRAIAFALLGINDYLTSFSGDVTAQEAREQLTEKLIACFKKVTTEDWVWYEDSLTYCNAQLPHALIATGDAMGNAHVTRVGLESLAWLAQLQCGEDGQFVPIGCNGFYPRGGERARFDQQPIEASTMTLACLRASDVTRESRWREEATRAFEWFLGRNDLGVPVCNTLTGACHDGLHPERLNANQGAEATVSYLLALVEMRLADQALKVLHETYERTAQTEPWMDTAASVAKRG